MELCQALYNENSNMVGIHSLNFFLKSTIKSIMSNYMKAQSISPYDENNDIHVGSWLR